MQEGIQQGMQEGIQQGMQEGMQQGRRETAKLMLRDGEPVEKVVRWTGLSEETILSL